MSNRKKQANPNDIEITSIDIEEGKGFELIYIPAQTQILHAGKEYRFLLPRDGGE